MKAFKATYAFLYLLALVCTISCNDTDDGSYVEPITLYEKVTGNWTLNNILQIDETAKVSGIKPNEISLFEEFNFNSFNLSLAVDNQNQPTTYQVNGTAPHLFPVSGYWDLNSSFPAASGSAPILSLYSDAGKSTLIGQLSIISVPGATPTMELQLTRKVNGVAFVSYNYQLSKSNQE